jgi:hypothetical protein
MNTNIGSIDRVLRVALAFVGIYLLLADIVSGSVGLVTIAVVVLLASTSAIGFCPVYKLLKLSTKK